MGRIDGQALMLKDIDNGERQRGVEANRTMEMPDDMWEDNTPVMPKGYGKGGGKFGGKKGNDGRRRYLPLNYRELEEQEPWEDWENDTASTMTGYSRLTSESNRTPYASAGMQSGGASSSNRRSDY